MKKQYIKIAQAACVAGLLAMASCNTFESEPLDYVLDENVTNPKDTTAVYMKGLFYAVYNSLPNLHNRLNNSYLDAATDDGVITVDPGGSSSLENYRNGTVSPGNIASLDGAAWTSFYQGIRRANLFLKYIKNYPSSSQLPAEDIKQMIAETRFLRAYYYFELVKRWGGVPMVGDNIYDITDDYDIPRSSLNDCMEYILSEISPESATSCYNDLLEPMGIPSTSMESYVGRMNKGAALALISRVKLYMASPLYQEDSSVKAHASEWTWQAAADAAKKVIDLGVYDLFYASTSGHYNFLDMFGGGSNDNPFPNKEFIMFKEAGNGTTQENNNSPCGYMKNKCKGYTSPSQNLVDAFLMLDGKMPGESTKYVYDDQNPYVNRDPRLTFTIFYNGSRWLSRDVETFNGGKDRSYVPGLTTTQTGYYLRKFLSLNENRADNGGFQSISHHYPIIRYAEILLNYAEALNETNGDKTEIENCLIQIRKRAGIEAGDDNRYGLPASYTQDEMRTIIHNERRIELAYEEHRFWDIRRWKIAGDVMNKPLRGVNIFKNADGSFQYDYVNVRKSTFADKMYWYPIARGEGQGNTKLTQNPGWDY